MTDPVALSVGTLTIDIGYSLEKTFTKLIHMNLLLVFYLIVNQG